MEHIYSLFCFPTVPDGFKKKHLYPDKYFPLNNIHIKNNIYLCTHQQ